MRGVDVAKLRLAILTFVVALTAAAVALAGPMAALRTGPEIATALGATVQRDRAFLITLSVALAASAVSMVGPMGFVGLIAPHLARRLARAGAGVLLAFATTEKRLVKPNGQDLSLCEKSPQKRHVIEETVLRDPIRCARRREGGPYEIAAQISDPRLSEHMPPLTLPWDTSTAVGFIAEKEAG